MTPTPPETDAEKRWAIWCCPTCGQTEMEPEAVDRDGEPVCEWHTQEGTRRLERVEVVPLARAEAAETALREAEEAAQDFIESSAPTGWSPLDRRAYNDARDALRDALKRARTTTTEGERDG